MDAASLPRLSVVTPVGPGDLAWRELLAQLASQLGAQAELLVSATTAEPAEFALLKPADVAAARWRWLPGPPGRAAQQNLGASVARGRFLWFLHADSRLEPDSLAIVLQRCTADPAALWYFDLRFLPDGPELMWVNALGARIRSRAFGMPFGDQGLALSRDTFLRLGGFRTDLPYGEDHQLVWAARRSGVPLRAVDRALYTSARKYQNRGWLRTTLAHLCLTWRQAFPEIIAWLGNL